MLKHIKNWWKDNAFIVAIGTSFGIVFLSLISVNVIPSTGVKVSDKFLHVFAYFILIWSWMVVFREKKTGKPKLILIITLTVFGIILEVLQGQMGVQRTPDWKDVLANVLGLGLGMITFKHLLGAFFK